MSPDISPQMNAEIVFDNFFELSSNTKMLPYFQSWAIGKN